MSHRLLSFVLVLVGALPVSAAEVVLVRDSEARAEIVIAENPSRMMKLAATELQQYAAKISGAKLRIVTTPSGGELIPIFIGKSPQTDAMKISDSELEHGAFRLIVKDDAVVLLGGEIAVAPEQDQPVRAGDHAKSAMAKALLGHAQAVGVGAAADVDLHRIAVGRHRVDGQLGAADFLQVLLQLVRGQWHRPRGFVADDDLRPRLAVLDQERRAVRRHRERPQHKYHCAHR